MPTSMPNVMTTMVVTRNIADHETMKDAMLQTNAGMILDAIPQKTGAVPLWKNGITARTPGMNARNG